LSPPAMARTTAALCSGPSQQRDPRLDKAITPDGIHKLGRLLGAARI
jgi:hypothetical protein